MWLEIVEMLLPILLKILEDSPEDQAVGHMKRRGLFFRLRLANAMRAEVLPKLMEAVDTRLSEMSDSELQELVVEAKAAKAARGQQV